MPGARAAQIGPGLERGHRPRRTLAGDLGRFSDAEAVLAATLDHVGPNSPDFRYLLNQLLYWEGRFDEMRRRLQDGWSTSPDKAGDLRDLWLIDSAVVMVDPIRAAVEDAARKAPDDDRVWLAHANLALLSGQPDQAHRWLDDCLGRRPDDPVVWRTAPLGARRRFPRRGPPALAHLPADRFTRNEALTLGAWFAARERRDDRERTALEQLIEQVPGDTQALERLAVLANESGQSSRAADLRRRKAEIDRVKERYFRLLEPAQHHHAVHRTRRPGRDAGRGFEARGWWFLASRYQPGALATAAIERLGPPRPDPLLPVGQTLAFHLGELAGLPPDRPAPPAGSSSEVANANHLARVPRRGRVGGPAVRLRQWPVARSARFPRRRPAASACSTTTATAGSTSMSFKEARFRPIPVDRRPAIDCSATAATARSRTPPNGPASPG